LTLIEAMFALSILAIGLLSLFALHQAAITASQLSYRTSQATILAQDQLDQLGNMKYRRGDVDPWLVGAGADPTSAADPLADLEYCFDIAGGNPTAPPCPKVDALGSTGGAGGKPAFTRTYDVTLLDTDPTGNGSGRLMIKSRVTFQMSETGKHHGVTLIETRSFDQY
jgi:type II secretory pathway pseudopilin PulG